MISHNLADVFAICDRVFVLRLGKAAGEFKAEDTTEEHVIGAITGLAENRENKEADREKTERKPEEEGA